jgi:hypothetical protein
MNDGKAVRTMNRVLGFAAVTETITGLALLIVPSLVGRVLLGQELAGVAIPVARVTGIALIALGLACWPATPLIAMLIYSLAITAYLIYLGLAGEFAGLFLWPAVVLHAFLFFSVGSCWLRRMVTDSVGR